VLARRRAERENNSSSARKAAAIFWRYRHIPDPDILISIEMSISSARAAIA
jgi:hypothetical protein